MTDPCYSQHPMQGCGLEFGSPYGNGSGAGACFTVTAAKGLRSEADGYGNGYDHAVTRRGGAGDGRDHVTAHQSGNGHGCGHAEGFGDPDGTYQASLFGKEPLVIVRRPLSARFRVP